jgi:DnaJ-class molecular chaperone
MYEESHYKVLGVPENASQQEIKAAYRKLSLKYHPDKNVGKPETVEMFQKIGAAFDTLGDPVKRAEYDAIRSSPFARMHAGEGGGPGAAEAAAMNELFGSIFGFGGAGPGLGGGMPGFGPAGMMFPPGANIRVFRNGVPVQQKPPPITQTIAISMEQVLKGASVPVEVERSIFENGHRIFEKETIYVSVPKGTDDNEMLLLRDLGHCAEDQTRGDIKIFFKVHNNTPFQRHGLDLVLEKHISLKESLCGVKFDMTYIDGRNYVINNQVGNIIVPEYQKVIPGLGLSREGHSTGNLLIHFKVQFPERLNEQQIATLSAVLN